MRFPNIRDLSMISEEWATLTAPSSPSSSNHTSTVTDDMNSVEGMLKSVSSTRWANLRMTE